MAEVPNDFSPCLFQPEVQVAEPKDAVVAKIAKKIMSLKFALQKTQSQLVQRIPSLPVKYVMFPLQGQELGEIEHCIDLLQVFYSILCSEKSYDHIISNFNFDFSWS